MRPLVLFFAAVLISVSGFSHATGSKDLTRADVSAEDRARFAKEEKLALIIGISDYPDGSGLSRLEYADSDARELGKQFAKLGYRVKVLVNSEATRGVILNRIDQLANLIDKDQGTFLIAFSGHGFAKGEVNYIAPFETDINEVDRTGIKVTEILARLKNSGAKRRVVLLDACRNDPGGGGKGVAGGQSFVKFKEAEGESILFSTKFGSKSWEYSELKHGVFTHYVLKALQGAAAQAGDMITFRSLADYVASQVKDYGFERNKIQVPFTGGEAYGDFLLAGGTAVTPATAAANVSSTHANPATAATGQNNARSAGEVFRDRLKDGSEGPEMVVIPAGSFEMGSNDREADERPVHTVTIGKPFALGATEVSFADYERYAAATGKAKPSDEGWGRGNRPVINVDWHDAVAYARWLSEQTSKSYRLPSEAEWEYAARAGSGKKYWWGDEVGRNNANCDRCGSQWDNKQTAPAKSFERNGFGLYDTAGNVREWTADCWNETYRGARTDGSAWTSGECGRRVVRGGFWGDYPAGVRSTDRAGLVTMDRYGGLGFRLAQDLN